MEVRVGQVEFNPAHAGVNVGWVQFDPFANIDVRVGWVQFDTAAITDIPVATIERHGGGAFRSYTPPRKIVFPPLEDEEELLLLLI